MIYTMIEYGKDIKLSDKKIDKMKKYLFSMLNQSEYKEKNIYPSLAHIKNNLFKLITLMKDSNNDSSSH
jgi:hemerythrin